MPPLITVFYVESVSVVDFLVAEKGPQVFVQFVREAAKSGLDAALQKHYDCRNVAMLEDRWLTKTFAAADARVSRRPRCDSRRPVAAAAFFHFLPTPADDRLSSEPSSVHVADPGRPPTDPDRLADRHYRRDRVLRQ